MKTNHDNPRRLLPLFALLLAMFYGCSSTSPKHFAKEAPPPPLSPFDQSLPEKSPYSSTSPKHSETVPPCPPPTPVPTLPNKSLVVLPQVHIWKYFTAFDDVESKYATYSYLLSGKNEKNQKAADRYMKLINAIQQKHNENIVPSTATKEYNVFLIPNIDSSKSNFAPNYRLSTDILAFLKSKTKNKHFDRPGPFIITLYHPINSQHKEKYADILFLDLTDVPEESFNTFLSLYENRLTERPITNIHELSSFRAKFLEIGLIANECIGVTQIAYSWVLDFLKKTGMAS